MDYKAKKAYRERSQGWRSRHPSKDVPMGNYSRFGNPTSRTDNDTVAAKLKVQTTRAAKHRKPSMPKMPWDTK